MKKLALLIEMILILVILVSCNGNNESKINEQLSTNEEISEINTIVINNEDSNIEKEKNNYHPIIYPYAKDSEGKYYLGFILGGSKDGQWYSYRDFNLPDAYQEIKDYNVDLVKGDELYNFYSNDSYISTQKGNTPSLIYYGSLGESVLKVEIEPFTSDEEGHFIGLASEWDAMPRNAEKIDDNSFAIDLNNDGNEEIINVNEYPFKTENGEEAKKVEIVIEEKDGTTKDSIIYDHVEIEDNLEILFLDLNGDSNIEILTIIDRHNLSISGYEYRNGKTIPILDFYMGD